MKNGAFKSFFGVMCLVLVVSIATEAPLPAEWPQIAKLLVNGKKFFISTDNWAKAPFTVDKQGVPYKVFDIEGRRVGLTSAQYIEAGRTSGRKFEGLEVNMDGTLFSKSLGSYIKPDGTTGKLSEINVNPVFSTQSPVKTVRLRAEGQEFDLTPGDWVFIKQGNKTVPKNIADSNGRPVFYSPEESKSLLFKDIVKINGEGKIVDYKLDSNGKLVPAEGTNGGGKYEIVKPDSSNNPISDLDALPLDSSGKIQNPDSSIGGPVGVDPDGKTGLLGSAKKQATKILAVGKDQAGVVIDKTKVMAGQGVQNVKGSLKFGFSSKNLLMTAGITVGVDLMTQVMRGEKPSPTKGLKVIATAEFAGSVAGSVTGAAAGSFFVPFLTAIPVVGGVMSALAPTFGSIVGGGVGAYLAGDLKKGKFSVKDAVKNIDWTGVAGQTIGSTAGSMLGATLLGIAFPPLAPLGMIIGGIVGGYVGNIAAHTIANFFGKGKIPDAPPTDNPSAPVIRVPGELVDVPIAGSAGSVSNSDPTSPEPVATSASTVSRDTTSDY